MATKRDPDSTADSEFGLAEGMIDPISREQRAIEPYQELWEIAALPKTFGGSEAGLPGGKRPLPEETPVPRRFPGDNRE